MAVLNKSGGGCSNGGFPESLSFQLILAGVFVLHLLLWVWFESMTKLAQFKVTSFFWKITESAEALVNSRKC